MLLLLQYKFLILKANYITPLIIMNKLGRQAHILVYIISNYI